jgi:hydrogenase expression/formation protein HypD
MPNYIDEFRNSKATKVLVEKIQKYDGSQLKIMEVCGTHTMAISRFGIRNILPDNIKLISGPGCPVCVTPSYYINSALELSENKDVIILTFGDMMRIPNDGISLLHKKAEGADIRIIYSPLDSIKIAKDNTKKNIVLLSVGFETTTPIIALTIDKAKEENLKNLYVLTSNKTIPEALKVIASDKEIGIDAFLYPGHVSTIIGTRMYKDLLEDFDVPGVIAGFEPLDILSGIDLIIENFKNGRKIFANNYSRVVKDDGNKIAIDMMYKIFEPCDDVWRGIGNIAMSGLTIREGYSEFDAKIKFNLKIELTDEPKGCLCGEILKGKKLPNECTLYGKKCTPQNPVGSCMVSSEGTCAAYYKYEGV